MNMKRLDDIIMSEFSTDLVIMATEGVQDDYSEMLKEFVPEDKLNELDERINRYIVSSNSAAFRQGFIRGIAAAAAGVEF